MVSNSCWSVKIGCILSENEAVVVKMPGHTCIICGNNPSKDTEVSFHHFPSDASRILKWLSEQLSSSVIIPFLLKLQLIFTIQQLLESTWALGFH